MSNSVVSVVVASFLIAPCDFSHSVDRLHNSGVAQQLFRVDVSATGVSHVYLGFGPFAWRWLSWSRHGSISSLPDQPTHLHRLVKLAGLAADPREAWHVGGSANLAHLGGLSPGSSSSLTVHSYRLWCSTGHEGQPSRSIATYIRLIPCPSSSSSSRLSDSCRGIPPHVRIPNYPSRSAIH